MAKEQESSSDKKVEQANALNKQKTELIKLDDEIAEVIEGLPPEAKEKVRSFFKQTSLKMMFASEPFQPPFLEKVNEKHISKIIDHVELDSQRDFTYAKGQRLFQLIYTVIGIGVFLFLVIFLVDRNQTLLSDIIKYILGAVGGMGGGVYLLRKHLRRK